MTSLRQSWLVALRELRERSRSRAFRISVVIMILVVVAVIVLPSLITGNKTKDVGLTGSVASALPAAIEAQSKAVDMKVRVHRYDNVADAEHKVRDGKIDVLVVDGAKLEWRRQVDQQLQAVVAGAIQLVAVQQRAAEAGISAEQLARVLTPVALSNVELGQVAGRTKDDETAALVMTVLLFMAITTYGALVLTGVVEEKSSRVVEVLLARMPARNLLAGKVIGIGLLGFGQLAITALAALIAARSVDSFDLPAARGSVVAWAVVWFVLGYALYATVYGALGSLASRPEDAQSVAGPVSVVLIAGYFISFATIGSPDSAWAKVVSYLPPTAPLAMPNRIAMSSVAWWEPVLAAVLTLLTIGALVRLAGRIYTAAVLHSGPTLKLRAVWRASGGPR